MSFVAVQMDRICRTCLSENTEMRSVFIKDDASSKEVRLLEMLMSCSTVEVAEGDGLPGQVCLQCIDHITKSYSFKQLCERSDHTLRQLVLKSKEPYNILQKVDTKKEDAAEVQLSVKPEPLSELVENVELHLQHILIEDNQVDADMEDAAQVQLSVKPELLSEHVENIELHQHQICINDNELEDEMEIKSILHSSSHYNEDSNNELKSDDGNDTNQTNFQCEQCTLCFTTISDLESHQKLEHICNQFTCKVCEEVFDSASTLFYHSKVHNQENNHLCVDCGKVFFKKENLLIHMQTHTCENYMCYECGRAFSRKSSLASHCKTHLSIETHESTDCKKKFGGLDDDLNKHMKTHYSCSHCGKGFGKLSYLKKHKRQHAATATYTFTCEQCSKTFSRLDNLARHNKYHCVGNTANRVDCLMCLINIQKRNMRRHIYNVHANPVMCSECGNTFPDGFAYVNHKMSERSNKSKVKDQGPSTSVTSPPPEKKV